ncbi:uncharacterized protein LOC123315483 [Coccinella septempunctata]|uniref:uncharacterized protein LOC123315483 n=1 Tax=Coccinella septempunctata TaxID=41139 RepID=UPI001D092950|nr:uncharacterized protein LOC123315483 [Coccinella septempunctata]
MDDQIANSSSSDELELHSIDGSPNSYNIFDYKDPACAVGLALDIIKNDVDEVSRKISLGHSVRAIDNQGDSLLHLAVWQCRNDDMRIIDLLLQHEDIDINALNFEYSTPLLQSIKQGKVKVASHLIEKGADVDPQAFTVPLHLCVKKGLLELAETLIKAGADLNAKDVDKDTALHLAVYHTQQEILLMLLYYGAEIWKNYIGLTPFLLSIQMRKFELSDILLRYEEIDSSVLDFAIIYDYPNLSNLVEHVLECESEKPFHYYPTKHAFLSLQNNPEMFKIFWTKFHIHYEYRNILIELFEYEFASWEDNMANCDTIMEVEDMKSTKLTEISENLPFLTVMAAGISAKKQNFDKTDEDFLQKFGSFLLSYGLVVYDVDLEVIFEVFGYCELFKLLLQMDIRPSHFPRINLFSYFIYTVSDEYSFQGRVKNMLLLRTCDTHLTYLDIHPMLSHTVLPMTQLYFDENTGELPVNYTYKVPKLVDLARNRTRDALCVRYKVKNSRQFYTVLKLLNLPVIIKKLIGFEVPIYRDLDYGGIKEERLRRISALAEECLLRHYRTRLLLF